MVTDPWEHLNLLRSDGGRAILDRVRTALESALMNQERSAGPAGRGEALDEKGATLRSPRREQRY